MTPTQDKTWQRISLAGRAVPFLLPALVARVWTLSAEDVDVIRLATLRGLWADCVVALAMGHLLAVRRFWWLLPVHLFVVFVYAGNIFHIHVNAANIDAYAARLGLTREFAEGSIFSFELLAAAATMLALAWFSAWLTEKRLESLSLSLRFGIPIVSVVLLLLTPLTRHRPDWVQLNVFEQNLDTYILPLIRGPVAANHEHAAGREDLNARFLVRDVAGERRIASTVERPNVLLVMIEGLSERHLQDGAAPLLNALAERGLHYRQFVSHQRQTNRGLYAALCADYPNFKNREAKSDIGAAGKLNSDHRPCLPAVLAEHGYRTVFLQGAKLQFMNKIGFATFAGFQEIYGAGEFPEKHRRYGWGVDDWALFEEAATAVRRLEMLGSPWFLTVLTVGTHHPYLIPDDWQSPENTFGFQQALNFSAEGLEQLLLALERDNMLDRTLVLITSDESASSGEGLAGALNSNWSTMIALTPNRDVGVIDDLYAQLDLAVSVLDYASLLEVAPEFPGRSLFRQNTVDREVVFGNIYGRTIYVANEGTGDLLACGADRTSCDVHRNQVSQWFGTELQSGGPADFALISDVYRFVSASDRSGVSAESGFAFRQIGAEITETTTFMSAFSLELKTGEAARWRFAASELERGVARVELHVRDTTSRRYVAAINKHIFAGQALEFEYEHQATQDTLFWTFLVITPQPDVVVQVDEVSIQKLLPHERSGKELTVIVDPPFEFNGPTDLLATSDVRFGDCVWNRVIDGNVAFSADACPKVKTLIFGPYWTIPANTTLTLDAEIVVSEGVADFTVDMASNGHVFFQESGQATTESSLLVDGAFQVSKALPGFEARIWLHDYSPGTRFKIERLRVSPSDYMPEWPGRYDLLQERRLAIADCGRYDTNGQGLVFDEQQRCPGNMALIWGPYWDIGENSRVTVRIAGQTDVADKDLRFDIFANQKTYAKQVVKAKAGLPFDVVLTTDVRTNIEGVEFRVWDMAQAKPAKIVIDKFDVHIEAIPPQFCFLPGRCK